ncbi:MAG TPA: DUF2069 domain-containing protein [Marinagarivorans sp.]
MSTTELSSDQQIARYDKRALYAHWATLFFYCALLALFSLHQWFRPEGISLFQWSVQCLPLLLFWFGLRIRRRRTYLWLGFVLFLYFIKGVEGVMGFTPTLFDWCLLTFSTSLFITCIMAARWLMLKEKIIYEQNQAAARSDSHDEPPA